MSTCRRGGTGGRDEDAGSCPRSGTEEQDSPANLQVSYLTRRLSTPTLVPSYSLAGAKGNRYGSRFWPLEGEVSVEEEGDEEGGESPDSLGDEDFFQDAIRAGFSVDELMRAEALAANASPKFASAHGVTGHARHVRRLTTRVVDAVAELRVPCGKWQGPLPKPRITPRMSLGDVWVTDQRSGDRGSARRLLAELESEARAPLKNGGPAAPESVVAAAPASKDGKKTSGDWSMQVSGLYGLGCTYMGGQRRFRCVLREGSPGIYCRATFALPLIS